uniref:Non-structural protein sigma 1 s n=1 Tax=Reovirus sp. TaxID=10891 RepID=Q85691_9REOV|nr:non-structural protein sigma 1 s [Reovirus sp.]
MEQHCQRALNQGSKRSRKRPKYTLIQSLGLLKDSMTQTNESSLLSKVGTIWLHQSVMRNLQSPDWKALSEPSKQLSMDLIQVLPRLVAEWENLRQDLQDYALTMTVSLREWILRNVTLDH